MQTPLEEDFQKQCEDLGIPPEAKQYRAIAHRRFPWDFAWPSKGILVEIQGGVFFRGKSGHTSGVGVRRDTIKNNLAVLYGFRPFQFTTDMVRNGKAARFLQAVLSATPLDETAQLLRPQRRKNGTRKKSTSKH